MDRYEIAVILSALNFLTLKMMWNYKQKLDRQNGSEMPHAHKES